MSAKAAAETARYWSIEANHAPTRGAAGVEGVLLRLIVEGLETQDGR